MTTYQGIAVVTQTLRQVAWDALRVPVPDAIVTMDRPEESPAARRDEPRLNIYLIQVGFEATLRNNDLPTRDTNGSLTAVPQVPLMLRYLFSYFGPTPKAHLMLGAIETAFHESPVLDPAAISLAVQLHQPLQDSGLETQRPPARIVPGSITLEELSRFWSGFFQMPYTLSTVWDVGPAILSSAVTPTAPLPVRQPEAHSGGMPPALDALPAVTHEPGFRVPVSGPNVAAGQYVCVDGQWSQLEAGPDGTLGFALPAEIQAGRREAQIGAVNPALGKEPAPIAGARPVDFDVRPDVKSVTFNGETGEVEVAVAPMVQPGQDVTLGLHSLVPDGTNAGPSATIPATIEEPANLLAFPTPSLDAGEYLAILTVDGVASLLVYENGSYAAPSVRTT